ncbi:glycosyltransferase [Clostridium carnis]
MKKVMFLIPNLKGGGAEKVLVDIINKLDTKKFNITLILLNKQGVYLNKINKNINIKALTSSNKIMLELQKYLIVFFPRLYYKLKIKEKYDVEIAFLEGLGTKLISRSNNKQSKKIAWIHIDLLKKHWTKKLYFFKGEENSYNKFNEIIFVSKDSLNSFEKLFQVKNANKKIIYNPIITEEVIALANKEEIKFDKFTIVSVGRLNKQKGYDLLIRAHANLVKKYNHNLLILGEGEERLEIENLINSLNVRNTVSLKGFTNNPYPYIKAANLIVSSSRTEGYPLVLLEAVILEKAIIATNVTGNKEILNYGESGIMCECNVEDIEKNIEKVLKNKELLIEYENRSKKRKLQFNYKEIINEIESLL